MARFVIVHDESESGAWGDVDHIARPEQPKTLCGREWNRATRRERLRPDHSERTACHKCRDAAHIAIRTSLVAAQDLAAIADLNFCDIARRVGI
jgi:hypothetical protein